MPDVAISSFLKRLATARRFGLLRNSNLTVPMYAYRFELLVFGASLTSVFVVSIFKCFPLGSTQKIFCKRDRMQSSRNIRSY